MVYLAQRDLDRFAQAVRGLDGHYRRDAFPRLALRTVQSIVPGISAAYNEIPPPGGEAIGMIDPPDSAPSLELIGVFDANLAQHPLINQVERSDPSGAQLISDFLPEREFHRLPLYGDFY
ncbi:MAG TPA: hypothetical protein VKU87_03325, partial [Thermomicrobiaceae bacterium]|nr:hypothetical protein [Thermomicrobiaceae bacterium]